MFGFYAFIYIRNIIIFILIYNMFPEIVTINLSFAVFLVVFLNFLFIYYCYVFFSIPSPAFLIQVILGQSPHWVCANRD